MKQKIETTKIETKYIITKGENSISVIVKEGGLIKRLSIYRRNYFNKPFVFENSDPEIVKVVAELLLEAAKLKEL